jgi:hypothetical protein
VIEYQREPPDSLAEAAWAKGSLTPLELLRVAAWKSAQGLGWLSLNTEQDIRARTAAAIDHLRPWRGHQMSGAADEATWSAWRETSRAAIGARDEGTGLLGLSGVGYPVATAILAVLDPEVWPVMDRWAVMTVFGTRPAGTPLPTARWQRAKAYEAYGRHLATVGRSCWGPGLTMHRLDQQAMKASMKGGQLPPGWSRAALP